MTVFLFCQLWEIVLPWQVHVQRNRHRMTDMTFELQSLLYANSAELRRSPAEMLLNSLLGFVLFQSWFCAARTLCKVSWVRYFITLRLFSLVAWVRLDVFVVSFPFSSSDRNERGLGLDERVLLGESAVNKSGAKHVFEVFTVRQWRPTFCPLKRKRNLLRETCVCVFQWAKDITRKSSWRRKQAGGTSWQNWWLARTTGEWIMFSQQSFV